MNSHHWLCLAVAVSTAACAPGVNDEAPDNRGLQPEQPVRVLIDQLADPSPKVRFESAEALIGKGATAIEPLTKIIQEDDWMAATQAVLVLGEIGQVALPGLAHAATHSNPSVRAQAVAVLSRIVAPGTVAVLVPALLDDDPWVRQRAARSLGQMGPLASDAAPALVPVLADEHGWLRRTAVAALISIGPAATPALAGALENRRPVVRQQAAWALGELGNDAASALVALEAAANDPDERVRRAAVEARQKILGTTR